MRVLQESYSTMLFHFVKGDIMSMLKQSKRYRREQVARWKTPNEMKKPTQNTDEYKRAVARTVATNVSANCKTLLDLKPSSNDSYVLAAIKHLSAAYAELSRYVDPWTYPGSNYIPTK